MSSRYTLEDIEFLKNNYPEKGSKYCSEYLNRSRESIINKCLSLKINFNINNLYDRMDRKVSHKQFINVDDKYSSYILGFIWADGYIGKKEIQICINSKDLKDLESVFLKTGNWRIYSKTLIDKRNDKNYNQTRIITKNKLLSQHLINNDYKIKSHCDCNKILKYIPENFRNDFFRGYFDGDGCFYHINDSYRCFISGSYEQDWSSLENLFKELNIKYNINKKIRKNNKYSDITISNKNDIDIFANYIYKDWDNIGLKRKYNYYNNFSKNIVKRHYEKKWTLDEVNYLIKNYNGKNVEELSKDLNRTKYSINSKLNKIKKKKYEDIIR